MRFNRLNQNFLLKLSAFFIIFSTLLPKAHALVVAPFIAIGAVQLLVWLVGILSVPITVIVKVLGRLSNLKTVVISLSILSLLTVLLYLMLNKPDLSVIIPANNSGLIPADLGYYNTSGVPAPEYKNIFVVLDVIFTVVALPPIFMVLYMINRKKHLWDKMQLVILSISCALTLASIIVFLIFNYLFQS